MLLMLKHEGIFPKHLSWAQGKLWHNWNSNGFYDKSMSAPTDDRHLMDWRTHVTAAVRQYWDMYLKACNNAEKIVHLKKSIEDADAIFGTGKLEIDAIFQSLTSPPKQVEEIFTYRWVEEACAGRRTVVVSPFAELIKAQWDKGNVERLRPRFMPSTMGYFSFPYCFGNDGPHSSSFKTIEFASELLTSQTSRGDVVLLSCGSMGVPLADKLQRRGVHAFYCGGAMQLYFGIMGERWRRVGDRDRALHPQDDLLSSLYTAPELWIDPVPASFVPPNARSIEDGCYW
jgi:hypothetical protein